MNRSNIVSKTYTGNTTFPINTYRGYLYVVMTAGTGTIEVGGGGGLIPLEANVPFEPRTCPTSELVVTTTGTFVVLSDV